MKILFVAMANSIHAVRWIAQADGRGWGPHLFPAQLPRLAPPNPQRGTIAAGMQLVEDWPLHCGRTVVHRLVRAFDPD